MNSNLSKIETQIFMNRMGIRIVSSTLLTKERIEVDTMM